MDGSVWVFVVGGDGDGGGGGSMSLMVGIEVVC